MILNGKPNEILSLYLDHFICYVLVLLNVKILVSRPFGLFVELSYLPSIYVTDETNASRLFGKFLKIIILGAPLHTKA